IKSPRSAQQALNRVGIAEAEPGAGMNAVTEIDALSLRRADEPLQFAPLRRGIGQAPALAMVGIVLRRVEIGVHAPRGAEGEQAAPVRHRPERSEESFDDAAAAKPGRAFHARRI